MNISEIILLHFCLLPFIQSMLPVIIFDAELKKLLSSLAAGFWGGGTLGRARGFGAGLGRGRDPEG